MSLPASASSVSKARSFLRDVLDGWQASRFEEAAVLLVSELVTNAVLHTTSAPRLTVRFESQRLWVGVRDDSPVIPALKRYALDAATGRGLQLVERVAARWGVQEDGSRGKVVWFELDAGSAERFSGTQDATILEGLTEIELSTLGEAAITREPPQKGSGPVVGSRRAARAGRARAVPAVV